jgi:hypothetical protein
MIGEYWIGKEVEGRTNGLIYGILLELAAETEVSHEERQAC